MVCSLRWWNWGGDGHGGGVKWAVAGCWSWNIKSVEKQVYLVSV